PRSARKPRESNASFPAELNTLPRIPAPNITSRPTVRKHAKARPHIFCSACPKPGTIHPATPAITASSSRLESCAGTAGTITSSAILGPSDQSLGKQCQNFFLNRSGHARLAIANVYVHFAAHAKFRQINSRLNRIARAWNQVPHVMGFEPVHVYAVAV